MELKIKQLQQKETIKKSKPHQMSHRQINFRNRKKQTVNGIEEETKKKIALIIRQLLVTLATWQTDTHQVEPRLICAL